MYSVHDFVVDHPIPHDHPMVKQLEEWINNVSTQHPSLSHHFHPISYNIVTTSNLNRLSSEFVITPYHTHVPGWLFVFELSNHQHVCIFKTSQNQYYSLFIVAKSFYFKGCMFRADLIYEKFQPPRPSSSSFPSETQDLKVVSEESNGANATPTTSPLPSYRQILLINDVLVMKNVLYCDKPWSFRHQCLLKIFDIADKDVLKGDPIHWEDFAKRLAETKNKMVCLGNKQGLQFRVRSYYNINEIETLWRHLDFSQHEIEGITFTHRHYSSSHYIWKYRYCARLWLQGQFKRQWFYKMACEHLGQIQWITQDQMLFKKKIHLQLEDEMMVVIQKFFQEKNTHQFSLLTLMELFLTHNDEEIQFHLRYIYPIHGGSSQPQSLDYVSSLIKEAETHVPWTHIISFVKSLNKVSS